MMRTTFLITGGALLLLRHRFIIDFNVVSINSVEFNFIIIADYVSLTFIGVVTLIASCVVLYRKDYMAGDPNIERFI